MHERALDICRRARSHGLIADWRGTPALGSILIGGPDAADYLHCQLTSDVIGLAPGQDQLTARLTRTGALVTAGSLHRLPDHGQPFATFLLIVPAAEILALVTDLAAHIVTEDVILEDVTDDFSGWVVQGPLADQVVARTFDHADASTARDNLPPGWLALSRSLTGDQGWVLLRRRRGFKHGADDRDDFAHDLQTAATAAELIELNDDLTGRCAWDWLRIEAGWPVAGRDYQPGKAPLPQTGLEQRVASTTKGCYLGQEVVARLRTYGTVALAMRGLVFAGEPLVAPQDFPAPGSRLLTDTGEAVGTWASSAASVIWSAPVALALLDRKHRTPGSELRVEVSGRQLAAQVVMPPFYQAVDHQEKARSLHDRAVHLFSHGDDDTPIKLLEEALRLDPNRRDSWEALGVMLGRAEKYHEAIDTFRRLEEIAPDEPMVHTNLSLFYMKIGDKEEAERQRSLGTSKRLGVVTDTASLARQETAAAEQRRTDARHKKDMFNEVLAVDPDDGLALMGLGNALVDLEDYDTAAEHLGRACIQLKDNSALYVSLGKVLEKLDRTTEAVDIYRRGVEVASRRGDLMPLKEMEHRLLMLQTT